MGAHHQGLGIQGRMILTVANTAMGKPLFKASDGG